MSTQTAGAGRSALLRGRIQNLRRTRCNHEFVFSSADRTKMGATAIAAGLAGLGGIATGLSGMAMDTTEQADLLEFDLDGKAVRAWVWVSVFNEGDEVEVVADQLGDVWQGYGIRRISDQIIALHPHCSRGRYAHYKASAKWWFRITLFFYLISSLIVIAMQIIKGEDGDITSTLVFLLYSGAGVFLITGFVAFSVLRKYMGFVKLAEGIFERFGWSDIKNIDLPAVTKKKKKPGDPGALGYLFFRYSDDMAD
ncbi:conserved membrane hypothetical protein [Burkholderia cenocepacia]|uniref:putative type VI secretion system effector n=1 Tax=Burkholderia cenocepacia TaxID=95486 RepID=UPI00192BEAE5|nr:putative type VI secretion system effector [Burkholderia cenocepacia]CAD9224026.1 conserved membrane hypothetical protein [Burkholderia cenocepacia]